MTALKFTLFASSAMALLTGSASLAQDATPDELLWGDTHLHTYLSPDAYAQGNTTATPDDAYQFAKGMPVLEAYTGARIQIETPLDFLVVTDHAEYAGITRFVFEGDEELLQTETGARYSAMIADGLNTEVFFDMVADVNNREPNPDLNNARLRRSVWDDIIEAAEAHNDPGNFTSFIGWEWSSLPNGRNLHRIVFFPQGEEVADQFLPFSAFESDVESDFWAWLDETSAQTGADFVAIPHNGNISGGLMFPTEDRAGNPIDETYAQTRMRWEPVIEVTQIKGDSETHPDLSPDDEFADFETYDHALDTTGASAEVDAATRLEQRRGDYTRQGLMRGLQFDEAIGENPFRYGMIGATDSHTAYSTAEEDNFWGKMPLDAIPANYELETVPGATAWDMSASGLAAVWATENTRQAITEAFQRREVYGTSGPRIALRLFGGWDFDTDDADDADYVEIGYEGGVPMGGELTLPIEGEGGFMSRFRGADEPAPHFLIHAAKDPVGANLDRIQVIKGWVDADGETHERVYDVAWSDGREMGEDGRLPAVGNTVDLSTGDVENSIGDAQLAVVWEDPDFDPSQYAFFYVRVLQIPTVRHSTLDAIALEMDPSETGHAITIQERAYSSPIWYSPAG